MINVTCTSCGELLHIKVEYAGKRARCPYCSTVFTLVPIERSGAEPLLLPDQESLVIVDRQPMWMRPISATIGRLYAPLTSVILGTTAPFKPGPKSLDEDIRRVAEGFTKGNTDDRLELQLGASMPLNNLRRIWQRKGLYIFGKLLGIMLWPTSEMQKALGRWDCYDPFAHSVALYNRDPAILAHELGHAEDFANRKWRTLYILARAFPPVMLYQEWKASTFGIKNLRERGLTRELKRANRVLGGGFCSYIGFVLGIASIPMALVVALVGQAVGALFQIFGGAKQINGSHSAKVPELFEPTSNTPPPMPDRPPPLPDRPPPMPTQRLSPE